MCHCHLPFLFTETMIGCKRLSFDEDFSLTFVFTEQGPLQNWDNNKYVSVLIDVKIYIGLITDTNDAEQEAELLLLSPPLPSKVFSWPSEEATYVAPYTHLLDYVNLIENSMYNYEIATKDILKLRQLGNVRIKTLKNQSQ